MQQVLPKHQYSKRAIFKSIKGLLPLFSLCFLMIPTGIHAQIQPFNSNGTYTVPSGVDLITIQCWGAGGSGGGRTSSSNGRGGGGGGGAFACSTLTTSASTNFNVTVGTGGTNGGNGGDSFVRLSGATVTDAAGGTGRSNNQQNGVAGGSVSNSIGFIRYAGGTGGSSPSGSSGGGGGAAGFFGAGGNGSNTAFGLGNGPNSGNGGAPRSGQGAGNNGSNYGGGGSGAIRVNSGSHSGGVGGSGFVTIEPTLWFNPIDGSNPGNNTVFNSGNVSSAFVSVSGIEAGSGLSNNSGNDRFNKRGFESSGNLVSDDYFELTFSPQAGYQLNLSSVMFTLQKSSTGPVQFAVRTSADNFSSNIETFSALPNVDQTFGMVVDLSNGDFQGLNGSFSIRIYGYTAPASSGTCSVNDFIINGRAVPSPFISSVSPAQGCSGSGQSVVITGLNLNDASTVKFNGINTTFTVNSATQITAVLPAGASTGPIQVLTPLGLATSSTFQVLSTPATPANFSTSVNSVCPGATNVVYTVPAVAGLTYNWAYSGSGATINGSGNSVSIDFSASATAGVVSVTASNACGTSPARTVSVAVAPAAAPVITPTYCRPSGLVLLSSSAASSYVWNTGAITQEIEIDQAGTYSVTVMNAQGCSSQASIEIGNELVTNGNFSAGNTGFSTVYSYRADIAGATELYPEGTYAIVPNANTVHNLFYGRERNNGTGNIMVINGHPGLGSVVWSQNSISVQPQTTYYFSAWAMSTVNGNNAVLQFSINGNQVGTIAYLPNGYTNNNGPYNWVRFYGTWNSGSQTSANLSIVNLNTVLGGNDFALDDISFATMSPIPLSISPTANTGLPICAGSPLFMNSNAAGGSSPFVYAWTGPNGFTSAEVNPNISASATTAMSGMYQVAVTDAMGCTANQSFNVSVQNLPAERSFSSVLPEVCSGLPAEIRITGAENGIVYQLRDASTSAESGISFSGDGSDLYLISAPVQSNTSFRLFALSAQTGCSRLSSGTTNVVVTPTPELNLQNIVACSGTVDLTLPSVTSGSTGGGTLTYWANPRSTQTVYTQNFNTENGKGISGNPPTANLSGVDWRMDISAASFNAATDWFQVVSGQMEARDMNGIAYWFSAPISIEALENVTFSLGLSEAGTLEPGDFIEVHYRIDGGLWIQATNNGSLYDDFSSATASTTGLSGSILEIRVTVSNNATDEYHRFDNLVVTGERLSPISNPSAVGAGTYFIQSASGVCVDIEPLTVTVTSSPSAAFNFTGSPFCEGGTNPQAIITGVPGVFSSSSGLVFSNAALGEIDLSASTPGTYTVVNTVTPIGACPSVSANRTITITPRPSADFQYANNAVCQSINATPVDPTFLNGGSAGVFSSSSSQLSLNTSTGAINVSSSLPGNYAVINTRAASGGCPAVRDTAYLTVNPYTFEGSINSSISQSQVCEGESVQLFSSGTTYLSALLSERFEGNFDAWTVTNTSVGGNPANAAWSRRVSPFSVNSQNISSPDNSGFYLANSFSQNGTSTSTVLQSPQLSSVGYSSLNLEFKHFYNHNNSSARVEVSVNGITWSTLATYTSNQGSAGGFSTVNLNLNAYTGYPVLYIRFNYNATGRRRYWAIDDIVLSGQTTNYTWGWSSNPAGYQSNQQNPVHIPAASSSFILQATNTFGCSVTQSPIPVTVKDKPVLTSTLQPTAICSGDVFSYAPVYQQAVSSYSWTRPASPGIGNPAQLSPQTADPSEVLLNNGSSQAQASYLLQSTLNGCSTTHAVIATVNPRPSATVSASQTVCNGSGAGLSAIVSGGFGVLSYAWSPTEGLSDPNILNPTANPLTASQNYALTVTDENGCSFTTLATTVTNAGFGGTAGLWTGAANSDWDNCSNWSDGRIPTSSTTVVINNNAAHNIQISTLAQCRSLTVQGSGSQPVSIVISGAGQLQVAEDVFLNKLGGGGDISLSLTAFASFSCRDLTLAGSAFEARNARFLHTSATASCQINRNLIISSGGYLQLGDGFTATPDPDLHIGGNLVHTGAIDDFVQNDGWVCLTGSQIQGMDLPLGTAINKLRLNKENNSVLLLSQDLQIAMQLELQRGKIALNNHNLIIGTNTASGLVSGASDSSYVLAWEGASTGAVRHLVHQVGRSYYFPVGDENHFTPFELSLEQGSMSGAQIELRLHAQANPNFTGTETISLNRYWTVEASGINNPLYSVSYVYANADVNGPAALLFPAKFSGGGWQSCIESMSNAQLGNGSVNTTDRTLTWSGLNSFSEFTAIGNGNALPIELLEFTGEPDGKTVVLNWITASEINNRIFIVERSNDGKNFKPVGELPGAGNSNTIRKYSLIDDDPKMGVNYYRLRQEDYDGTFSYSDWVAVNFTGEMPIKLDKVFADRNTGKVFITLSQPENQNLLVQLFDATGRQLHQEKVFSGNANWSGFIQPGDLRRGTYILTVFVGNKMVQGRFVY